jgi:ParB family transcriptional regulator, chromosome partitioning protein
VINSNSTAVFKEAAVIYKVDTDAITAKVRQEFTAKEKAKKTPPPTTKTVKKAA